MEEISTGELFADLQVSYTEIVLVDILEEKSQLDKNDALQNRRAVNRKVIKGIKNIMKERFSLEDINTFMEKGFPREVKLTNITMKKEVKK